MTSQTYDLIALDMDGTLLNTQKKIDPQTLEAIQEADAQGKTVVLSTGRCFADLQPYPELTAHVHYGVLESGALIYDFKNEAILHRTAFDADAIRTIAAISGAEDMMVQTMSNGIVTVDAEGMKNMSHFQMGAFQPLMEAIAEPCDNMHDFMLEHLWDFEKVNLFHATPEGRERTRARLSMLSLELADAETTSLEISPGNVSKGSGLSWLCDYLKLPIERTIAVGDSYNDLTVLRTAGLSVAMGNAVDQVRETAQVIVADNDHNGVAEAIHTYLLSD